MTPPLHPAPLLLTEADVQAVRRLPRAGRAAHLAAVRAAFAELGDGTATLAPRLGLVTDPDPTSPRPRSFKLYATVLQRLGVIGTMTYAAGYGRPLDYRVQLCSAATGRLFCTAQGEPISHWATGAVTALATDLLARRGAARLALIGTGTYAFEQAVFIAQVRALSAIRCFSRDPARRRAFAERLAAELPGVDVSGAERVEEALDGADIVTTVTTSHHPVFDGRRLAPGVHVNAIGMHYPRVREVDTETVRRARVFVDDLAVTMYEKGDLLIPMDEGAIDGSHLLGSLGSLVAGTAPGRLSESDRTLFGSSGLPLESVAVVALLDAQARAAGIGTELPAG